MKIIALTGGIATGKSAVSTMLKDRGARIIDADLLAREVVAPKSEGWKHIVAQFGEEILTEDGSIDRSRLGDIVFGDAEKRERLEAIIHPKVAGRMTEEILRARDDGAKFLVLDIPLLFETRGLDSEGIKRILPVDAIVVVLADTEKQIERLGERDGLAEEAILERLAAQIPIEEKRALADYVIDNNESLEETRRQVDALWEKLIETE